VNAREFTHPAAAFVRDADQLLAVGAADDGDRQNLAHVGTEEFVLDVVRIQVGEVLGRIDSFSVTSLRFAKLIWRSCGLGVQARVGDLA
jgi:hypothetical protein